jgi:molecular chaperone GrpE
MSEATKKSETREELNQRIAECERTISDSEREMRRLKQSHDESLALERKYSGIDLMRDLLPIGQNLERLCLAGRHSGDIDAVLEGLDIIREQFFDVMQKHGLREITGACNPFNPSEHEEVGNRHSDEHPDGSVVEVVRPGYRLHDRVVRHSQVVVSREPGQSCRLRS